MLTVAVDAMGGDAGPAVTVPASLLALRANPDLVVILVGDQCAVLRELYRQPVYPAERVLVRHAAQVVPTDGSAAKALRKQRDSSMGLAVQLVADGEVAACVSAGNTGALMAFGRHFLGTFEGIRRPAICAPIPTRSGHSHVLDLGANVQCSATQLVQFAVMGSTLVAVSEEMFRPRVALLNVGAESRKGNAAVREAGRQLQAMKELEEINYVGYIEGHDLFRDAADVIVCDGFVGNVTLKASEELMRMLGGFISEAFRRHWYARLIGALTRWVLGALRRQFDPSRNNGASLLGLRGTVVKSHGSANRDSFAHAVETAVLEARRDLPGRIQRELAQGMRPNHPQRRASRA